MSAPARLGLFAGGLALVLAAGVGVGAAVGPIRGGEDDGEHGAMPAAPAEHAATTIAPAHAPVEPAAPAPAPGGHASDGLPAGLSASVAGFTFAPDATTFAVGNPERFSFRILGADGHAVTDFDTRHERDLHLVVVSADLGSYQHLHPVLDADGTWSTELTLPRAGGYRAYADFAAAGAEPVTLAAELSAAGAFEPRPLPAPVANAAVDGYDVHLDGSVVAGTDSEVRFHVARGDEPVTDLEPYLGAYGHLVAIRATDRAYLHVHPTEASSPSEVVFSVHAPTPGAYRFFLDFQHEGTVRTAAFTVDVPAGAGHAPSGSEERDHVSH
jgi:hypothetical protein